MNVSCILSVASDPPLGKIDKTLLSQQTLMELFVDGITNKEKIWGSEESPEDVSEWNDLEFNDAKEVVDINWTNKGLAGSISLQWLPPSAIDVYLYTNELTGTVDLTCLPDSLERLNLADNMFHGSVDLTNLPENMVGLYLYQNGFCGVTDFSRLPKSLEYLNLEATQLEGEIRRFDGRLFLKRSKVKDMRNT